MSADTGGSEGGYGQEGPGEPLEIVGRYDAKRLTGDDEDQHHLGFTGALDECARSDGTPDWRGRDMTITAGGLDHENPGAVGEYRAHCTSPWPPLERSRRGVTDAERVRRS